MDKNETLLASALFWLTRCELHSNEYDFNSNIQGHFEDAIKEIQDAVKENNKRQSAREKRAAARARRAHREIQAEMDAEARLGA